MRLIALEFSFALQHIKKIYDTINGATSDCENAIAADRHLNDLEI